MDGSDRKIEKREISAPRAGKFTVHVESGSSHKNFCILTVHDLGCNHTMWTHFLQHPRMQEICKRATIIHVDIPGQEDHAEDLPEDYTFPTMQYLGEDLICVLDQLDVKQVVGIGEGAGANILARFAMAKPDRVLAISLIHCTGTTAGLIEAFKDKLMGWNLSHGIMDMRSEHYLMLHRFGSPMIDKAQNKEQLSEAVSTFQNTLRKHINPRNLNRFVKSFMKRTNITESVGKLKCPVLMVTGSNASFNHTVHTLIDAMKEHRVKNLDVLEVDGVANVLEEKPEKLAEAFLFHCQGVGLVGSVPMPGVQRTSSQDGPDDFITRKTRSMSMEEADKPLGIYSSSPTRFGTSPKVGSPPRSNLAASPPK